MNYGSELIQVTTEARPLDLTDFEVVGGNTVNNSNITARVCAEGIGTITIRDQHGHILWQYEQTTEGPECYEPQLTLPDGVGDYVLTATISDGSQSDSMTADLIYEAVIDIPGTPTTGYFYVSGYAMHQGVVLSASLVMALIVLFALVQRFILPKQRAKQAKTKNSK